MISDPTHLLHIWRDVSLALVRTGGADLSPRQMSILLSVYLDPPPHTVRGLAEKLNVTKPVITRALDSMGNLDLVHRRRDDADLRNVLIQGTSRGTQFLEQFKQLLQDIVEVHYSLEFPAEDEIVPQVAAHQSAPLNHQVSGTHAPVHPPLHGSAPIHSPE